MRCVVGAVQLWAVLLWVRLLRLRLLLRLLRLLLLWRLRVRLLCLGLLLRRVAVRVQGDRGVALDVGGVHEVVDGRSFWGMLRRFGVVRRREGRG